MKKALLVVDIQNDFVTGGTLAVKDGETLIPIINDIMEQFDLIVASQDWHPENHSSFASNNPEANLFDLININGIEQVMWPDHCVQNSHGAEFCEDLNTHKFNKIFQKGTDKEVDSYSAFFDNQYKKNTGLSDYLKSEKVSDLYVVGIATDFCVKFSCIDAVNEGFNTYLISNACKAVNPNDTDQCYRELENKGVKILNKF